MEEIFEKVAKLSSVKKSLLEKILISRQNEKIDTLTIIHHPDRLIANLSYPQYRMWYLEQINPGNYNRPGAIIIKGGLNIKLLERCIEKIVQRHKIFGSTILTDEGMPFVHILESGDFELSFYDFSSLEEDKLLNFLKNESQRKFNLEQGPLYRFSLIELKGNKHLLLLVAHHIIFDHWSMTVFKKELFELYEAASMGQDLNTCLPALKFQFFDYTEWKNEYLATDKINRQMEYWKGKLNGNIPNLDMMDFPNNGVTDHPKAERYSFLIGQEENQKLTDFSNSRNLTKFMVLLATFKLLIYYYTGKTDILLCTPVSGRNIKEAEELIGMFVNTLILRTRFEKGTTFNAFLTNVSEVVLQALQNQMVPVEKVVEELRIDRNLKNNQLNKLLFEYRNIEDPVLKGENISIENFNFNTGIPLFDLAFDITEGKYLTFHVDYNTSLFDESYIRELAVKFQAILSAVIGHPNQTIEDLLPSEE